MISVMNKNLKMKYFGGIFLTTEQGYFLFHFSFEVKSIAKHFLLAKHNFV